LFKRWKNFSVRYNKLRARAWKSFVRIYGDLMEKEDLKYFFPPADMLD